MSKLLFFLFVLAALVVVADIAAKRYAEGRLASELEDSVAGADVEVDIGGFPFLPSVLSGELPDLRAQVKGFHSSEVRIELLDVTLERLRFDLSDLLDRGLEDVRARSASGTVDVPGSALDALLAEHGSPVEVSLEGDRALVAGRPIDLAVEGATLLLEAPAPVGRIEVPLPTPLRDLSYSRVDVRGSSLELGFQVRDPRLTLLTAMPPRSSDSWRATATR